MSHFDAPGVPDGSEHRLLVVPADPAHLEPVRSVQVPRRGGGDAPVDEHQLEAPAYDGGIAEWINPPPS